MTCCTLLGIGFWAFGITLVAIIRNLRIFRSLCVGDVSGDPGYNGIQRQDNLMTNMIIILIRGSHLQLAWSGRVRERVYVTTTIMK